MAKVSEIINCITDVAPLQLQEDYDNSGLLVGDPNNEVESALITFDITEEAIDEAIEKNCKLIISHHPIIFKGLKKLTQQTYIERIVAKAIKNDIALACMHTNLDNSNQGVSVALAQQLGLKNIKILDPMKNKLAQVVVFCPVEQAEAVRRAMCDAGAGHTGNYDQCAFNAEGKGCFRALEGSHPYVGNQDELHFESETRIETIVPTFMVGKVIAAMKNVHPYEEPAYNIYPVENEYEQAGGGAFGTLETPMNETDFLNLVQQKLNIPCLKHSKLIGREISKVAVCGGSGAFLIGKARSCGADIYITSDIKYHDYFDAEGKIVLVDAGHYETEQFSKEIIKGLINKKFPKFATLISERSKNPVHYYVNQQNQ